MGVGRVVVIILTIVCIVITFFAAALIYSSTLINYSYDEDEITYLGDHFEGKFNVTNGGFFAINDLTVSMEVRNSTDHLVMTAAGSDYLIASSETSVINLVFSANTTNILGTYNFSITIRLQLAYFITVTVRYIGEYNLT